jgi:hypothetical protein
LTNFGTNTIDLTGYRFSDGAPHDNSYEVPPLWGTTIASGESIVFVRESLSIPDEAAFRAWWGANNLPADLQVHFYERPGFDGDEGEELCLWDPETNLVAHAFYGQAMPGITFTYDTQTGQFGVLSEPGICGAFQALSCDDVGSPGTALCGPVVLNIARQPESQTVDAGMEATFSVLAMGLPWPRYQWYFNGSAVTNATAGSQAVPVLVNYAGCGPSWTESGNPSDFVIPSVQPANAGEYFVEIYNGLERVTSATVTLTVNTNPSPVEIDCPSLLLCSPNGSDLSEAVLEVCPGQTARFDVRTRGYPQPTFQWSWSADGSVYVDLLGATNRTLVIPDVQLSEAGLYRVEAQNILGTTNAVARLVVRPKPQLAITEVMPNHCDPMRGDWWEMTNLGDSPVNLCGYRWDDWPGVIGSGPTITNSIIIQPGHSVLFLESQSPESFIAHWGAENLPPNLQFIVFHGNGLNENLGDEINIWNPTASEDYDFIDSVVFSSVTAGNSLWFDPTDPCSEFGIYSATGQCGAFVAAGGCDVASPGWTPWTPPTLTSLQRNGQTVTLRWNAQPNSLCRVEYTRQFSASPESIPWTDLGTYRFPDAVCLVTDDTLGSDDQRFYRVVMIAPANCPCGF